MSNVVVVDDDRFIRETLATALTRAGHEVRTAEDGREALKQLAAQPADVVVVDILMPGQEGIETILTLKRRTDRPLIIAISGAGAHGRMDFLGAAARLGADHTLAKPFRPTCLLQLIERGLTARGAGGSCRAEDDGC